MSRLSVLRPAALALTFAVAAAACSFVGDDNTLDDDRDRPQTEPPLVTADGYPVEAPSPDGTPLPVNDDVRIGTLDNGLTYYVQSNDSPGRGLALRLVVNAGSLQQEAPESGAAHFLEHMLFNGTERFPGNELDRALQTIGVEIGPDLNAYTSFDETVYQLEIANITDETVDIGFSVLSEWASAATLTEADTVAERGVVREEIRLSDEGAGGVVDAAFEELYLTGSAYEAREPGGRDDLILATTPAELRAFYDRWYRPDLMAVIAVGDLPADRLEDEVRTRFADLTARGDGQARLEPLVDQIDDPVTRVVTHPDLSDTFGSLDYTITNWDRGTVGGERLSLMQDLYGAMIQNRLSDAADRGQIDLIDPWAGAFQYHRNLRFLGFNFDARDLGPAMQEVVTVVRRAEVSGFDDEELARAADAIRVEVEAEAESAGFTNDRFLADDYVEHFLTGADISAADAWQRRTDELLDEIDAAEVTELYRWEMARNAPLVVVVGPDPTALPTEADLEAAVRRGSKPRPITEAIDETEVPDELMTPPDPVAPAAVNTLGELDAVEWVFDNGATVRFRPSTISPNDVVVVTESQGGWSAMEPDDAAIAGLAVDAVAASGIGDLDRVATRRFLGTKATAIGPYLLETTEGFSGNSSTGDLEVLFQQMHLAYVSPRIDAAGLREAVERSEELQGVVATVPRRAADDAVFEALYAGDVRFSVDPPSIDELTEEDALDLYRQRFGGVDDLVMAIVGDADPDVVADLAARYVGTLPSAPADTWRNVRPEPVIPDTTVELPVGQRGESSAVRVVYANPFEFDARSRVELQVLATLVNSRLFLRIREELGATYGGFVDLTDETAPTDGIIAVFEADVDPERADEVIGVVIDELDDLAVNGPDEEELARALSLTRADYELVSNGQFIGMLLTDPDEEPLTFDRRLALLDEVDVAAVQAVAARVFDPTDRFQIATVAP
ncbi:MAG: insulinase family protein [Actinomycetota bacterium]